MKAVDLRRYVGICMTCEHWQIDVRPGAISDLGGWREVLQTCAREQAAHLTDCPGAGGRVKFEGRWVEPIKMANGNPATGSLAFHPLPRWWVAK